MKAGVRLHTCFGNNMVDGMITYAVYFAWRIFVREN